MLGGLFKTRSAQRSSELTNEVEALKARLSPFGDSAAGKALRGSSQVGTITVCFHPCWDGSTPPAGYEKARDVKKNATGLGEDRRVKTRVVKRTNGPLAASVSVRYGK